jgi:hypothetical protein
MYNKYVVIIFFPIQIQYCYYKNVYNINTRQLLFWALNWLCTMNFVLSFCRSTIDNDDNWVDCKEKWIDIPVIWFYDYVKIKIKRRRPAVLRSLISRRRRTATTRRLRTKYLLSEWIKKIF